MPDTQALLEKIQALPPECRAEVEDFVEFLAAKAGRLAALDRLLALAPALDQAGAGPITEDDIQAEIEAARAQRRARNGHGSAG
jgi:hypothetical protein